MTIYLAWSPILIVKNNTTLSWHLTIFFKYIGKIFEDSTDTIYISNLEKVIHVLSLYIYYLYAKLHSNQLSRLSLKA